MALYEYHFRSSKKKEEKTTVCENYRKRRCVRHKEPTHISSTLKMTLVSAIFSILI